MGLTLGSAVKQVRTTRTDLSARALSLAAGLSESYVGKVESDSIDPSFKAMAKISKILGLSANEIYVLINIEGTDL